MIASPFVLSSGLITLVAPFPFPLSFLRSCLGQSVKKHNCTGHVVVRLSIFSYALLHWSGFGRLVVGTYLIYVFVVAMYYYDVKFRVWLVPAILPLALYLAQLSRYGTVDNFAVLVGGSSGHHMIVTEDAINYAEEGRPLGLLAFWEQFQLLFLGWFPRIIWPEKPSGLGLTSVDTLYGRAGVAANHSISLGFLGEQYLLLGNFAYAGLSLMLVTILFLRRLVSLFSRGLIAPIAAFDVSLISFWGP